MIFVAICRDAPGQAENRLALRPKHVSYLQSLGDKLVTAGPLLDDDGQKSVGSLLFFEAADIDEAIKLADGDPFWSEGIFGDRDLYPFKFTIGKLA